MIVEKGKAGESMYNPRTGLTIPPELTPPGQYILLSKEDWDKIKERLDRTTGLGLGMIEAEWLLLTVPEKGSEQPKRPSSPGAAIMEMVRGMK